MNGSRRAKIRSWRGSLTLKSREQSPADLANGLRILLRTLATESKHRSWWPLTNWTKSAAPRISSRRSTASRTCST